VTWLTFGTATSPEPMSALDTQFQNVAAGMSLPCTALGTNAISLTPFASAFASFPSLSAYSELGGYRFVAINTSTGPVTAQFNGLGFLNVYHSDGVTQCTTGDVIIGQQYIITFHQALNSGVGGFYLENPSQPVGSTQGTGAPGGRLTLQSGVPVMFTNQLNKQVIFYAPYQGAFVPIYNGTTMQPYQFTSSLNDTVGLQLNMGGAANFPSGTAFDVFVTLIGGIPTLVATQWTNVTTRATTLSIFGGVLTNSGSMTSQTGPNTSATVAVNQGTFLGSVAMAAGNGATQWQFGANVTAGSFNIANYYNPVLFTSIVTDNSGGYTYVSATVRQARNNASNQHTFMSCSSERAIFAYYAAAMQQSAVNGASVFTGVGLAAGTFAAYTRLQAPGANVPVLRGTTPYEFSFTGFGALIANEASDGTNTATLNGYADNQLGIAIWL